VLKTFLVICLLSLTGFALSSAAKAAPLEIAPTTFSKLQGWTTEHQAQALVSFKKSCRVLEKRSPQKVLWENFPKGRTVGAWLPVCKDAHKTPVNDAAAKAFFERSFSPFLLTSNGSSTAEFTGYYVSSFKASPVKKSPYLYPIHGLPPAIKASPTKKYFTRGEIEQGALGKAAPVLYWATNPIDVFFLHVQGSGALQMPDRKLEYIGFAGRNNQPYFAIGKELVRRGILTKASVTMQTIRAWMEKNPADAHALMNLNTSYIFFKKQPADKSALGAMGVSLTAEHSIAIDPAYLPYGVPLWLNATPNNRLPFALNRLVITQDTGAAIKGALRGDFFWGIGEKAGDYAGRMHSKGKLTLLLPR
jgi:membrane-bound lytic murein transglycosylase A